MPDGLFFIGLMASEEPPRRELAYERVSISSGELLIVYFPVNWSSWPSIRKSKK